MENQVRTFTCTVDQLVSGRLHSNEFESKLQYPIYIDRYQRPFVWDSGKVKQLLEDLKNSDGKSYYLGCILLHENSDKKTFFVIDGQQRLTTLQILYHELFNKNYCRNSIKLKFYHSESLINIKIAKSVIKKYSEDDELKNALKKAEITLIKTTDLDLAFTFFDTQNSRGVRLTSTNLLKSYHLREVKQIYAEKQYYQRQSAKRWEQLENYKGILNDQHNFPAELFHKIIWRARRWQKSNIEKENRDLVLEEFQDGTVKEKNNSRKIPLYPNRNNMLSSYMIESEEDGLQRLGASIMVSGKSSLLPFSLRQPVHKGVHYFLFAEKYAKQINEIFRDEPCEDQHIRKLREYYEEVVKNNSYYLQELFVVNIATYYDKYGSDKLSMFVELLGLLHGNYRLSQHYIFRQSILKFMRDYNLLDVISHSFRPEEVFASLSNEIINDESDMITQHVKLLEREKTKNPDQFEPTDIDGDGVNERFLKAFMKYYNKIQWGRLRSPVKNSLNLKLLNEKIIKDLNERSGEYD